MPPHAPVDNVAPVQNVSKDAGRILSQTKARVEYQCPRKNTDRGAAPRINAVEGVGRVSKEMESIAIWKS